MEDDNNYQTSQSVRDIKWEFESINSESIIKDDKLRKLEKKRKLHLTCLVCGDDAKSNNFGAISCESCKAFFRRNALKSLENFTCPINDKCKIDVRNRRFCKSCRIRKCFYIGMRKEFILTDNEKIIRKKKVEENQLLKQTSFGEIYFRENSQSSDCSSSNSSNSSVCSPTECDQLDYFSNENVSGLNSYLTTEDRQLLIELKEAYSFGQNKFRSFEPCREKMTSILDLVNISEISIIRIVEMVKNVNAFKDLSQTDQISLLKGGCIELLILRGVQCYDEKKKLFLDSCDKESASAMKIDKLEIGFGRNLSVNLLNFMNDLVSELNLDREILLNILILINLFSADRPGLIKQEEVKSYQERYFNLLRVYLNGVYGEERGQVLFPKLLLKMADIRNLRWEINNNRIFQQTNLDGVLPLMKEMLDMKIN